MILPEKLMIWWKTSDKIDIQRYRYTRLTWLMWRVRLLQLLDFHQWWHRSSGNQPWIYISAKCPSLLRGHQHFIFSNWTFRSELPPSSSMSTWNFASPTVTTFKKELLVFSVTPFKINRNKNQNRSIDKVQNLGNERRYIYKDPRQDSGQRNISYTRYPKKCFTQTPGGRGVLPRILDRGVPRRLVNPNPI